MAVLIQVDGLTKHYHMGDTVVRALDGVNLTIKAGEFVSLTGASGSGKSTMMHLLGCLDRPTRGAYHLDGELVSAMTDKQLAIVRNQKIGFVFQTFNLIQRTSAIDNVSVPMFYARRTRVGDVARRSLERVGLGERCSHKPNELSGGERQRVAIARAIVNEPKIILADEPTGNLDTRTGRQIMEIFHELNDAGVTIILVTHEPEVALQAERIIRMRDGHIYEDRSVDPSERREIAEREEPTKADRKPPPMARPVKV
ncbi:MAG: ABC transporter ATP-binding protein [Phycisphaerae bacterium]